STTTVRPTASNIARAISRCSGPAWAPRQIPVIPHPTAAGVFGIARTTGTLLLPTPAFSKCCSRYEVGTDAATEITTAFASISGAISFNTSATTCGLTPSSTMSAPFTAARLSLVTPTPTSFASAAAFSPCFTVAATFLALKSPCFKYARSKIPPSLPAPSTANFLSESLRGMALSLWHSHFWVCSLLRDRVERVWRKLTLWVSRHYLSRPEIKSNLQLQASASHRHTSAPRSSTPQPVLRQNQMQKEADPEGYAEKLPRGQSGQPPRRKEQPYNRPDRRHRNADRKRANHPAAMSREFPSADVPEASSQRKKKIHGENRGRRSLQRPAN